MFLYQALNKLAKNSKDPNFRRVHEKTVDQLDEEFRIFEALHDNTQFPAKIDIVVVLSGRGGFEGQLLEDLKKHASRPFNTMDTLERMKYGIQIAKRYMQEKDIDEFPPVYFNGVAAQNEELRKILEELKLQGQTHYLSYPIDKFIIDEIEINNTLGQVLGLNRFMINNKNMFPGNSIAIVSDTMHIPRVMRTFGENSGVWQGMTDTPLRRANIHVYGCNSSITRQTGGEIDILCETEAMVNYGHVQSPPSIGKCPGSNITNFYEVICRRNFDIISRIRNGNVNKGISKLQQIVRKRLAGP